MGQGKRDHRGSTELKECILEGQVQPLLQDFIQALPFSATYCATLLSGPCNEGSVSKKNPRGVNRVRRPVGPGRGGVGGAGGAGGGLFRDLHAGVAQHHNM